MRSLLNRMDAKLDLMMWQLAKSSRTEEGILQMTVETDAAVAKLTAEIAVLKTGEDAAVVAINSIPGLMAAAGVSAAQIDAITASLKNNSQPFLDALATVGTQSAPPGPIIVNPPVTDPNTPPVVPPAPGAASTPTAGMARPPSGR